MALSLYFKEPNIYSCYGLFEPQSAVDLISYLRSHRGLGVAVVLRELPSVERLYRKERSPLPVHPLAQYLSGEVVDAQRISRVVGAVT